MKPTCSIVIRAYNEEKHIGRLLAGILQQTMRDSQIILVDSGSTDTTVAIAQRFPVKIVHIRPEEFTFGRSLNLGIDAAEADLVVMASAHVYPVYPDWLEKLLAPFSDSQVALSYGKQRGGETTQFSEHQIFKHWFPDHSVSRQEHPFCNNANSAIRRSLWQEHPYSESISALEDLAWARWAFEKGWAISYAAEAEVIHLHKETWKGVFNRYRREGMAFKQIYPQENFSFSDLMRAFSSNSLNDLRSARQQGVLAQQWSNVLHFRWNQFWGTYQGYRQGGALTWQLKQAFYYPREQSQPSEPSPREVKPIQYRESGQENRKR